MLAPVRDLTRCVAVWEQVTLGPLQDIGIEGFCWVAPQDEKIPDDGFKEFKKANVRRRKKHDQRVAHWDYLLCVPPPATSPSCIHTSLLLELQLCHALAAAQHAASGGRDAR